jgi:Protein of unknown function (DUF3102)
MKRKNVRSLDTIAVNIHQLARGNIIDIGDLLLEAKSQCEHGDWLNWLRGEFDWSVDTAERYMRVAALNAKFRSLRNLKLAVTTLYELADHEEAEQGIPEDRLNLPAIIDELAKHASKTRLSPRDASGLNATVESGSGFPSGSRRASLCDAHRDRRRSDCR